MGEVHDIVQVSRVILSCQPCSSLVSKKPSKQSPGSCCQGEIVCFLGRLLAGGDGFVGPPRIRINRGKTQM